jgi:glycerate 2-kinase
VIAAGKAAPGMALAFARRFRGSLASGVVAGTHLDVGLPPALDWVRAGHPLPDSASETAGRRALQVAREAGETPLVVLLSGGASALLAVPAEDLTLETKRDVTARLLRAGADIHATNTVRKHLSGLKGGRLAACRPGPTLTLAISDVVGNDLSVIGSGPTVADGSTFADALAVLDRFGGRPAYPAAAVALIERGTKGLVPETPKRDDTRLARSVAQVIGSARDVLAGATRSAQALGYHVVRIDEPVTGEAREAAIRQVPMMFECARSAGGRVAVLSTGETTVKVSGAGRGGRNQEFALAAVRVLAARPAAAALASVGSDGVDGSTDAAGAFVDSTSLARAAAARLTPDPFLDDNDSYHFFRALGDLIVTGPTGTNVGDFQVLLVEFS